MASASSPKATPPRGATSRLLAMKFMNRLGSATNPSSPKSLSPLASGASTPKSKKHPSDEADVEDQQPSKRRRTSEMASPGGVVSSGATSGSLEAAMQASVDDEERRRQAAIKKRAADLGDEHWTWNAPLPPQIATKIAAQKAGSNTTTPSSGATMPFAVVHVGYSEIDSRATANDYTGDEEGDDSRQARNHPRIMRFNMKKQASGDSDDSDDSEHEGKDNNDSRKRSRSNVEPPQKTKKKDHIKLKNLTSLSSQGGQNKMTCHRCGRPGHKQASCPSANSRRSNSRKG